MGIVSEVIPCFARKKLYGYTFVAYSSAWRSPSSAFWFGPITCSWRASRFMRRMVFSCLSFLVAVPSAIKVFNWTATLYKGSIAFETPMLFALGFVALFTVGRTDRACFWRRWVSTCTCTTRIS